MTGEKLDAEAFLRVLALRVPQYGNALMIIKQQLEQKIIEKNLQLGEQYCVGKCRKKDNQGGEFEVACIMLKNGIGCNTDI